MGCNGISWDRMGYRTSYMMWVCLRMMDGTWKAPIFVVENIGGFPPSNKCFSTFSDYVSMSYVSFSQCFSAIALEGRDTTREP